MSETTPSPLGDVITIYDRRIRNHLDRMVRSSVEETMNALLDVEAVRLCNAQRGKHCRRAPIILRSIAAPRASASARFAFGHCPSDPRR
jgi:hypothetical protein